MSYYKVNKIKKLKLKSISKIIYIPLALIILNSCAKHNAGIVKQTYHDLTSHYNGYFNANEIYNIQIKSLKNNRTEDYENILPLYPYGSIDEIKNQNSGLSVAIEKARLSIQTHQEKEGGKNYVKNEDNSISNWSDDAFLLIGKSYYMQGQMDSAISCFKYITANFEEGVDARSKKKIKKQKNNKKLKAKAKKLEDKNLEKEIAGKDIRPSKKILVHEATRSEALIWLANSYTSNNQFTDAESVLTFIRSDKKFLKDFDNDVDRANAFLFLSQNNNSASLEYLNKTLESTKKQKNKVRTQFILGQLNEQMGNIEAAADFYKNSIKSNPNFEMVFYAKLKQIQMNRKGEINTKETDKLIAKLLKDNKNKDYYDQLYYEKALIALNDNDREEAKEMLAKSIEKSTTNSKQKGISYIALADLNYDEENYIIAQAYYDSSLTVIENSYFDFNRVSNRSIVLTDLVDHLTTIKMNDSLLVLAKLTPKELESFLYKQAVDLFDAEIKQEEKNKQAELMSSGNTSSKNDKNAWYFYSEASKSSGYKKFKQIWGDIELADDWRRSDKSNDGNFDNELAGNSQEDEYFERVDVLYQTMLKAVPNTDIAKKDLENDIIYAYYNAAVTYKIGLYNLPKSVEMFETLNKKYPSNIYKPEALYQLYVIYSDLNKTNKATDSKNELITTYPNNKYALYIKDPKTLKQVDNKTAVEDFYDSTYNKYLAEEYDEVILICSEIDEKFEENHIKAKFDLLKAMAIGGKKLEAPFITSLEHVVSTYKNTEEQAKASQMLAYLKGEKINLNEKSTKERNLENKPQINSVNTTSKENLNNLKEQNPNLNDDDNKNGLKLKLGNKELNIGGKNSNDKLNKDE